MTVDGQGVRLCFGPLRRKEMRWEENKEVDLIGENVFNHGKKHRTGDKYICFSRVRMDADERFISMVVKWPPKDQLFAEYSEKRLEYVMTLWRGQLETYNVEDLYANSSGPHSVAKDPANK